MTHPNKQKYILIPATFQFLLCTQLLAWQTFHHNKKVVISL